MNKPHIIVMTQRSQGVITSQWRRALTHTEPERLPVTPTKGRAEATRSAGPFLEQTADGNSMDQRF